MKKILLAGVAATCLTAACGGSGAGRTVPQADEALNATSVDLTGKWLVTEIQISDGQLVRPAEVDSTAATTFTFANDSVAGTVYGIVTNCNSLGGTYAVRGDSIGFNDGFSTMMLCPDMTVEEAIKSVLPQITTFSMPTDSTLRLSGASAAYIKLRRTSE